MENYLVVLFKNKKRKRIIKKFVTLSRAKEFFNKLMLESDEVVFDVVIENAKECKLELGLLQTSTNQSAPVYITDEYGRNIRVKLEEDGMSILQIRPYKQEELIFDVQKNKKINTKHIDYYNNTEFYDFDKEIREDFQSLYRDIQINKIL